jgi:hypothetical protein
MAKADLKKKPRRTEATKAKNRAELTANKKANKALTCSVSGCTKGRNDLYPYCLAHSKRYRKEGHPTLALPRLAELRSIETAIKEWLAEDYLTSKEDRQAFKRNWSAGQQLIRNHPSFALPFYRLEGHSGYTQKSKAWVILSHYFHKQGHSLSDAMIRYMAVRLWAEFKWVMPEGSRKGFQKERHQFVNTWAGRFVLSNSGFTKTTTEKKVIAWERPWYVSENPRDNLPKPITKTVTTTKTRDRWAMATVVRAIGYELRGAVDHAMGTKWVSDYRLLQRASEALGLPNSTPSIHKHFKAN